MTLQMIAHLLHNTDIPKVLKTPQSKIIHVVDLQFFILIHTLISRFCFAEALVSLTELVLFFILCDFNLGILTYF